MGKAFEKIMSALKEVEAYKAGKLNLRSTKVSVEPVSHWDAQSVQALRQELNVSQGLFAIVLGVSKKTVEAWESGKNVPNGSASRLMEIISNEKDLLARQGIFVRT
jgi:putative transcriptional regulator